MSDVLSGLTCGLCKHRRDRVATVGLGCRHVAHATVDFHVEHMLNVVNQVHLVCCVPRALQDETPRVVEDSQPWLAVLGSPCCHPAFSTTPDCDERDLHVMRARYMHNTNTKISHDVSMTSLHDNPSCGHKMVRSCGSPCVMHMKVHVSHALCTMA